MVVVGGGGLWECPVREALEGAYGDASRHRARGGLLSLPLPLLLGPDERFGPLREGRVRWWRLLGGWGWGWSLSPRSSQTGKGKGGGPGPHVPRGPRWAWEGGPPPPPAVAMVTQGRRLRAVETKPSARS